MLEPILQPTYSATLIARLVAATLRGWQTAIFALGLCFHIVLGTCVDLPQPVFPLITTTGLV